MLKIDQLKEQVEQLRTSLLTASPGLPTLLRTIHTALQADKDMVSVLTEDEIGVIVNGLMRQTNTVIAKAAIKGKGGKAVKNITMDDL